ncbi:MAG TPA: portal protein [Methanosarcina sp.]|nr:portal protein [Methanosarcina sp.]
MARWNLPFGFRIRDANTEVKNETFIAPTQRDGAIEKVSSGAGFYGYNFGFDFQPKTEVELINKYRQIQNLPEVDTAVEDIVSEAVVVEQFDEDVVEININAEENEIPENVKEIICEEFKNLLSITEFSSKGHDLFRQWYVDGRLSFHLVANEADLSEGIIDVRTVDPRKIKKVREITKTRTGQGLDVISNIEEYFVFNDSGISENMGVKLSADTIAYVTSGLTDESGMVISYLHKAIKPANMLRMMEDAMLIYQMTRAPERRVFYVDVSGMQKTKAEQYLKDVMTRYKNKVVYNSSTGEIRDDRHFMSMLEDFWMPRQSNGRATEITTLPSSVVQGQQDAINTYKDKLAKSLNLPTSRMVGDTPFNLGRSMEITRDEVKFSKFIARLRHKFMDIFTQMLRVQLILKGVISPDDWKFIKSKIQYQFISDNNFAELRDNEILAQRLEMYNEIQPLIGVHFSEDYAKKKILRMTDEEIEEENKKIEIEREQKIALMKKYPELYGPDQNQGFQQ